MSTHNEERTVLSVLTYNRPSVLLRMTSLFYRRGYNIETLVVCETDREDLSRFTVTLSGDSGIIEQIRRQLLKLEDIVKVDVLQLDECAASELLLIKVRAAENRHDLLILSQACGCRVVDIGQDSLTFELSGRGADIRSFIDKVRPYGILEMGCTGLTALQRGDSTIFDSLI